MKPLLALLLAISVMPPGAAAADTTATIFVPVVSRTPGAFGSEWRTDLVISNISKSPVPVPFTITFTTNDGSPPASMSGSIASRTSYTFRDIVNIGFGKSTAVGVVHVTSSGGIERLDARARIYNTASPVGEFGQTVPGSRVFDLLLEHHLAGLAGIDGTRTNVGISNPWETEITFSIDVFDGEGNLEFSSAGWRVGPRQVLQVNDLFAWIGKPAFANATAEIATSRPAYVYASLVRSDSGDPAFVRATNVGAEIVGVVAPPCVGPSVPAPLQLSPVNPAPGWYVLLKDDTNPAQVASALSQKYGFRVVTAWHAPKGFVPYDLTREMLARLRCEQDVKAVYQDSYINQPTP
ncbi:MAG TPA: hypothetical protein VGF40_12825 [Thermoanaerobaculia bacterium]